MEPAMADPWGVLANMQGYENEVLPQQPRPTNAKEEVPQASTVTPAAVPSTSKRQVSSNACEPCRKRKSKCDGEKPHCLSCTALHRTPCNYDLDKDFRRKGALRVEIQKLKEVCSNYQFIMDSICLAEEPHLGQLMQLIRSNQPIETIANTWRAGNLPLMGQLQAAPLIGLDGTLEGNNFADSAGGPVMEMAPNQRSINICQSNVQINQPSVPTPGMPGMPGQFGILMNQTMTATAVNVVEDMQEAPLNLHAWYDEWGQLWPAF